MKKHAAGVLVICAMATMGRAQVLPGGMGAKFRVQAEIGAKVTVDEIQPTINFNSCDPGSGFDPKYRGDVVSAPLNTVIRPSEGVAYYRITTSRGLTFDMVTGSPLKSGSSVLPTSFSARLVGAFTVGGSSVPSGFYTPWIQAPATGSNHFVYSSTGTQVLENWFYGKVLRSGLNDAAGSYAQDAANRLRVIITLN